MSTRWALLATLTATLGLCMAACSASEPDTDAGAATGSSVGSGAQTPAVTACPGPDQPPVGKVAYSHRDDDGDWSLWLMDPDGSDPECLVDTPEADTAPAWSPDGSRLVFGGGDDLYVSESDGSDVTLLLDGGGTTRFSNPDWSPDGSSIVFSATHDGREEPDIMAVDSTGEHLRTLISSGEQFVFVDEPAWSPDGRHILFLADDSGGWRDLYLMRPDGSDVRLLLHRGFDLDGSGLGWSPDGSSIAFQGDRDGGCLYVVNARGKNPRRLVEGCSEGVDLTWSPDSRTILWGPSDNGPGDLYAVSSDGGPVRVVEDTSTAAGPSWQPN
jgi:Tol biopolymer transport system component